jgi:lipopolysaccharide transport system permease protein
MTSVESESAQRLPTTPVLEEETFEEPYLTISPTSGWAAVDFAEIWRFRDLLMSLASRDLKLRYK